MKKLIFFIALTLLTLAAFYACKKDDSKKTYYDAGFNEITFSGLKIHIRNRTEKLMSFKKHRSNSTKSGSRTSLTSLEYDYMDIGEGDLDDIVDIFLAQGIDSLESGPVELILYSDESYETLDVSQAAGFSVLYSMDGVYYLHKYFARDTSSGGFHIVSQLTASINDIAMIEVATLAAINGDGTYITHFGQEGYTGTPDYAESREGALGVKVSEFVDFVLLDEGDYTKCGTPAGCSGSKYDACKKGFQGWACTVNGPTICYARTLHTIATANNEDTSWFAFADAYYLRDSFMTSSNILSRYKEMYYRVSDFVKAYKPINLTNLADHLELGYEEVQVIDRLLHGSNSVTVYDSEFVGKAEAILDYYSSLTSNLEYKEIFSTIKSDLNTYANLTRSELIEVLNNQ